MLKKLRSFTVLPGCCHGSRGFADYGLHQSSQAHVEGEKKSVRDRASMVRAVVKISTCYQVTRGVTALFLEAHRATQLNGARRFSPSAIEPWPLRWIATDHKGSFFKRDHVRSRLSNRHVQDGDEFYRRAKRSIWAQLTVFYLTVSASEIVWVKLRVVPRLSLGVEPAPRYPRRNTRRGR